MVVSLLCCVLSGRGHCDEPITRPEESYWLRCVVLCDLETSWMRRPWPIGGSYVKNIQTLIIKLFNFTNYHLQSAPDEDMRICFSIKRFFLSTNSLKCPRINNIRYTLTERCAIMLDYNISPRYTFFLDFLTLFLAKVTDWPPDLTLNVLWVQKQETQIGMCFFCQKLQ
jgi:hypothetical protein